MIDFDDISMSIGFLADLNEQQQYERDREADIGFPIDIYKESKQHILIRHKCNPFLPICVSSLSPFPLVTD